MNVGFARVWVSVVAWAVVSGSGTEAYAQATISACVKTGQGQIRIVQPTEACLSGEQRLEWPGSAPSKGALRVLDANDKFVGWYDHGGWGDTATTTIPVGSVWLAVPLLVDGPEKTGGPPFYFNTPCPDPVDHTILHASGAHVIGQSQRLVKFAFGLLSSPHVVYYAGPDDPSFVPHSWESGAGTTRVCFDIFGAPWLSTVTFAPALTFDLSVFTPPFRISP